MLSTQTNETRINDLLDREENAAKRYSKRRGISRAAAIAELKKTLCGEDILLLCLKHNVTSSFTPIRISLEIERELQAEISEKLDLFFERRKNVTAGF